MRKQIAVGALAAAGAAAALYLLVLRPTYRYEKSVTHERSRVTSDGAKPRSERRSRDARRFSQRILNPVVLQLAGRRFSGDYAIIGHVGRQSGRAYRTPIVAHPFDGGFVIALPFGPGTDWCQNLQASGAGTLRHKGAIYRVGEPVVVTAASAEALLPPQMRRMLRPFKVQRFLTLTQVSPAAETQRVGIEAEG